ncbi:peptidoglycan-binding protein [Plectonema cf. radiosum LEGE 06105]|uniref:Peptidoglycan-binding protein n=2 Tax=Plectonema TaxID=1183 RepID=A0A8J7FBT1_9CYAN|nr:peptidoglycan-binding protein [Plectonema cf. radiosum LEGE 06105]
MAQTSDKSNLPALKVKYQKIPKDSRSKISWQSSYSSINRLERKENFSAVLKDYSMNGKSLTFSERSLGLNLRKQWDIPQKTDDNLEQRLLAQYYRGEQLPILRYGHTGDAVRVLQTLLTYNRYNVGITGRFDVFTETAVKAFQEHRRLGADGIVGPRTWQELTRYAAFHTERDPMEIPNYSNQPVYPWQRSFRGNFAESVIII